MSDASATDARKQRFTEVVRNFAGVPPKRFATLLPHRDGIAELRKKGASFGMIRELLAMAGIEVVADTVRRFYREAIEEQRTSAKRPLKREHTAAPLPPSSPSAAMTPPPAFAAPAPLPPAEPSRGRGPRIADPRNL